MDQNPLLTEQIEAGAELVAKFDKYKPVHAAYWLKLPDDFRWYLYVYSDQIDETNVKPAYGEIGRIANEMQNPHLDVFQVKVSRGKDPFTQAVLDLHKRYPGKGPIRYHQTMFGGRTIDGVYIYALPVATPSS